MSNQFHDKLYIAYECGLADKIRSHAATPQDVVNYAGKIAEMVCNAFIANYRWHKDGSQAAEDEIFVFGSNFAGIHGAGAARAAVDKYGAILGQGHGLQGRSYGIPTKDANIVSLSLDQVGTWVAKFKAYAICRPDMKFFMTRVGCGLAGFTDEEIAPMFIGSPSNINFPEEWRPWLGQTSRLEPFDDRWDDNKVREWAASAGAEIRRLSTIVEAQGIEQ